MGVGMRISISKRRLSSDAILGTVLVAYMGTGYLDHVKWADFLCSGIQLVSFFALIIYHCAVLKKVSKLTLYFSIYAIVLALITFIYHGDYYTALIFVFRAVSFPMLVNGLCEREPLRLLRVLTFIMEALIYVNLLTILLAPNGLYHYSTLTGWESDQVWFFGLRNAHPQYLMFGCFCSALNLYFSNNVRRDRLRFIIINVVMVWTIYLLKSGGGYTMLAVYVAMLLVYYLCKNIRISFDGVVVLHLVVFVAITVFSATYLFVSFFALFGKNGTATGRTRIWAEVFSRISKRPVWGYGIMKREDLYWLQVVAAGAASAHNTMMDIVFRGGFATLAIFLLLLFQVGKRIRNRVEKTSLYNLASVFFCALFVVYQSEGAYMSSPLFMIICLIWLMPNLEQQNACENKG